MPSSLSSSSHTDGSLESLESLEFIDSHFPTYQASHHDLDLPLPSFSHQQFVIPATPLGTFPVPHGQPLGGVHSAFSAPSSIVSDASSMQYYHHFECSIPGDNGDTSAVSQRASSWQAYSADYATVDRCHDLDASLQRSQSTSDSRPAEKTVGGPSQAYPEPNRLRKAESDRTSQRHPIGGAVTLAAEARIKKKRRAQLRKSTYRRNSSSLRPIRTNASLDSKRRKHAANKDEFMDNDDPVSSEDEEDSRPRPKDTEKEYAFACPFYRKWPTRHIDCMNRKLTRIQDVKQHIYRRHSQSPFYCPTCYKHFSSPDPRDEHIRQLSCQATTSSRTRSIDGISAEVHNSMKHRPTGRLTPVEQWYGIWELIFPGEKPPESPYFGGMVSEMLGMLRDLCQHESQRLLPSFMNTSLGNAITLQDLPILMIQMLDKVQDQLAGEPQQVGGVADDGLSSWKTKMVVSSPKDNESVASPMDVKVSTEPDSISGTWEMLQSPSGSQPIGISSVSVVEPFYDFALLDESIFTYQAWMDLDKTSPSMSGY